MALAIVKSRAAVGIHAPEVAVEVHISRGHSCFSIVGLPETAVKESRDRVRSALINSGFEFPPCRITVNLAPADLPKEGGRFDLAIAVGILAAQGLLPRDRLDAYEFAGELALSGHLKPFGGALLFAIATAACRRHLMLPAANALEAALANDSHVYGADHLLAVVRHVSGQQGLNPTPKPAMVDQPDASHDLSQVIGQCQAKRALLVAATGGHHLLLIGPPGTGKTLLATRLIGLLPPTSDAQALEIAALHSLAGRPFQAETWGRRPFRAPHHSASSIALVGGGSPPKPGEISLAHLGVLFLDELPEFQRSVLEALREPLEAGTITISRAAYQAEFPAKFQLIAAMNPCPCGFAYSQTHNCRCSPEQIRRYQQRLSGPFLDRIDLHLSLKPLSKRVLLQAHQRPTTPEPSTAVLREQVKAGWARQWQRQGKLNCDLDQTELQRYCRLDRTGQQVLEQALERWALSGRGLHRLLRVARTIADLAEHMDIKTEHVAEACSYRPLLKG